MYSYYWSTAGFGVKFKLHCGLCADAGRPDVCTGYTGRGLEPAKLLRCIR